MQFDIKRIIFKPKDDYMNLEIELTKEAIERIVAGPLNQRILPNPQKRIDEFKPLYIMLSRRQVMFALHTMSDTTRLIPFPGEVWFDDLLVLIQFSNYRISVLDTSGHMAQRYSIAFPFAVIQEQFQSWIEDNPHDQVVISGERMEEIQDCYTPQIKTGYGNDALERINDVAGNQLDEILKQLEAWAKASYIYDGQKEANLAIIHVYCDGWGNGSSTRKEPPYENPSFGFSICLYKQVANPLKYEAGPVFDGRQYELDDRIGSLDRPGVVVNGGIIWHGEERNGYQTHT